MRARGLIHGGVTGGILASLGIGAAGLVVTLAWQEGSVTLAVPVLQLVSPIAIERGTSR